jgi:hypothetical protein
MAFAGLYALVGANKGCAWVPQNGVGLAYLSEAGVQGHLGWPCVRLPGQEASLPQECPCWGCP